MDGRGRVSLFGLLQAEAVAAVAAAAVTVVAATAAAVGQLMG